MEAARALSVTDAAVNAVLGAFSWLRAADLVEFDNLRRCCLRGRVRLGGEPT